MNLLGTATNRVLWALSVFVLAVGGVCGLQATTMVLLAEPLVPRVPGAVKPALEYETARGILEGNESGFYVKVLYGPPKENRKLNRTGEEQFITHHLVFRDRRIEGLAKELAGRKISMDGKIGMAGDVTYFFVEFIIEAKD